MREIEFRAKRTDNYEWVFGFYSPRIWFPTFEQTPNIKTFKGADVEIDINTLGQYTGIKDKNGTKIFDGDIVKIPEDYDNYGLNAGEIYQVYFAYGGFRMKPKYSKTAEGYWLEDDGELEVIGNIFDNPELLKGEK